MSYQPTRFRLDSELGGRLAALSSRHGRTALGDQGGLSFTSYAQRSYHLHSRGSLGLADRRTPAVRIREVVRMRDSGQLRSTLLFRSATLGYYDLSGARQTENYGGIRPGCWINALPAGGIVLLPDATAGCECSYLNKAWIALEPVPRRVADQLWSHWDKPSGNFFLPLTLILSPALRFAAGESDNTTVIASSILSDSRSAAVTPRRVRSRRSVCRYVRKCIFRRRPDGSRQPRGLRFCSTAPGS